MNMNEKKKQVIAIGDWHGNTTSVLRILKHVQDNYPAGTRLVHCGDFGFWDTDIFTDELKDKINNSPHENVDIGPADLQGYLSTVNSTLEDMDMTIYVVLGNHEDYWELDQTFNYQGIMINGKSERHKTPLGDFDNDYRLYMTGDERDNDMILDEHGFIMSEYYPRIRIAPRAHVWEWDNVTYGALGGANSVDIIFRKRGYSWWEQEQPLEHHANRLIELANGKLDVLFTHDAPLQVSKSLYGHGNHLPSEIREWAEKSGHVVEKAMMGTSPALLFCGHHHLRLTQNAKMVRTIVHILDRETAPAEDNIKEVILNR